MSEVEHSCEQCTEGMSPWCNSEEASQPWEKNTAGEFLNRIWDSLLSEDQKNHLPRRLQQQLAVQEALDR